MGSSNFFAKFASIDPLAQALHLPGADKYRQQQMQDANSTGAVGPYAGVTPTLAGANSGYAPGGPGANSNYVPFQAKSPGGLFGFAQRFSSAVGNTTPNPDAVASGKVALPGTPGQVASTLRTGVPAGTQNAYTPSPYVAASQQANMGQYNPGAAANTLFAPRPMMKSQPNAWGP
jgi:hypothetical protein